MIDFLKKLLGTKEQTDYKALIGNGAIIIDVRTKGEYSSGHIKGSVNIPLNELGNQLSKIKAGKPVITCCASGMRSGAAAKLLKSKGFECHNGGSWISLNNKL